MSDDKSVLMKGFMSLLGDMARDRTKNEEDVPETPYEARPEPAPGPDIDPKNSTLAQRVLASFDPDATSEEDEEAPVDEGYAQRAFAEEQQDKFWAETPIDMASAIEAALGTDAEADGKYFNNDIFDGSSLDDGRDEKRQYDVPIIIASKDVPNDGALESEDPDDLDVGPDIYRPRGFVSDDSELTDQFTVPDEVRNFGGTEPEKVYFPRNTLPPPPIEQPANDLTGYSVPKKPDAGKISPHDAPAGISSIAFDRNNRSSNEWMFRNEYIRLAEEWDVDMGVCDGQADFLTKVTDAMARNTMKKKK